MVPTGRCVFVLAALGLACLGRCGGFGASDSSSWHPSQAAAVQMQAWMRMTAVLIWSVGFAITSVFVNINWAVFVGSPVIWRSVSLPDSEMILGMLRPSQECCHQGSRLINGVDLRAQSRRQNSLKPRIVGVTLIFSSRIYDQCYWFGRQLPGRGSNCKSLMLGNLPEDQVVDTIKNLNSN